MAFKASNSEHYGAVVPGDLGYCRACGNQLAVRGPDTLAGVRYEILVCCGCCGLPVPDHARTEAAEVKSAKKPAVAAVPPAPEAVPVTSQARQEEVAEELEPHRRSVTTERKRR